MGGASPYDQSAHTVRLEWGGAARTVVSATTYVVVADVLSFTTTVGVAADRGVAVLPWRAADDGEPASAYAAEHAAELARPRDEARDGGGLSLSPSSVRDAPVDLRRMVLPSPNGATASLDLAAHGAGVVAASLRNRAAVAAWLADRLAQPGSGVALVPAGERWPDGSLRVAVEDLYGVGAVLEALETAVPGLDRSPEAATALAAWQGATGSTGSTGSGLDVAALLRATGSGRELVERGYGDDVAVAAELDASSAVPVLQGTSFVDDTGMRAL